MDHIEQTILAAVKKSGNGMTINEIAAVLKKERHTTTKYLERLQSQGVLELHVRGKSKIYTLSSSSLASAIRKNDPLSMELQQVLDALEPHVVIKTRKDVLIEGKKHPGNGACYERYLGSNEKCRDCPVDKTFRSGKKSSARHQDTDITTHPIKNDNEVVAVVEIIKKRKNK